jgi:hypothetical protein
MQAESAGSQLERKESYQIRVEMVRAREVACFVLRDRPAVQNEELNEAKIRTQNREFAVIQGKIKARLPNLDVWSVFDVVARGIRVAVPVYPHTTSR